MSTVGSALRICAVRRTGPVKMLLAEVALLLSSLALAGADVTRVKLERDREPPRTRAEWCDTSGGSCVPREDCFPDTHIIASFCSRHPVSVCCLSKKLLCESVYSGYCTSDLSGCRAKTTHHVSELRCDDDHKCCVPDEVLRRRQDHGGRHWGGGWNRGVGCGGCGGYGGYGYGLNPYPRFDGYGPNPFPQRGTYMGPGWPAGP
ncbi:hypothetical protein LSAT2_027129 [Lamellibrachia satsuma]|nr:hypothetical protein LSAT2_027129 [Lamellibrachia satsuma]